MKGQIVRHCTYYLCGLFRIKYFQLTQLSYITVLLILFTVLSFPSHLRLAVLKPMALVLNLHHDLQRQRLHPKIMLLKIMSVVFLICGFTFLHYRFGDVAIFLHLHYDLDFSKIIVQKCCT